MANVRHCLPRIRTRVPQRCGREDELIAQIISGLVEKRSLDRAAADAIRQAITTGALTPGKRLTEVELAAGLDVSRGTVRAALQRLMSEGRIVFETPAATAESTRSRSSRLTSATTSSYCASCCMSAL